MDAKQLEELLKDVPFTQKQAGNNKLELILQAKDRFATKQLIESRLDDLKIQYKDGVKSSSSLDIKTTDFTSANISFRLYYKPSSSAGSGAGAEITALGECFQAYASYARQFQTKDFESPEEVIEWLKLKGSKGVQADRTLEQCITKLDPGWLYSGMAIANELKKVLGTGSYTYHRGSRVVSQINRKYQELSKKAGIALNINKWNPSDIWVLKDNTALTLDNISTLNELNAYIRQMYLDGKLFGISLKKTPSGKPTKSVYNLAETKPSNVKYKGYRIAAGSKRFIEDEISKDVYVVFENNGTTTDMQLRTFSAGMSGWQGEIKGATAAGGKIGGGNLQEALVLAGIPSSEFIDQTSFKALSSTTKPLTIKKFAMMYQYLTSDIRNMNIIEKDIETMLKKYDNNWLYSKYLGMQFLYLMLKNKKQDKVMANVVAIASSSTDVSSVFLKYS